MSEWRARLAKHPLLQGGTPESASGRLALAADLAGWWSGLPRAALSPLSRLLLDWMGDELGLPAAVVRGSPLLAVEAAAAAAATLWPWVEATPLPEAETPELGDAPDSASALGRTGGAGGASARPPEAIQPGIPAELPEAAEARGERLNAMTDPVLPVAREAVEAALRRAGEAEQVSRALAALWPGGGWSGGVAAVQQALLEALEPLSELLARRPEVLALADELGRAEGEGRRRRGLDGGGEEVVGVRMGGRLSDALPGELALLGDPDTEDLFYARWLEGRLMTLELTGAGTGGAGPAARRGPVVAVVDTSGSMSGAPERLAKAMILAVARRIAPQGRKLHLILFGGEDEVVRLTLGRGPAGLDALLAFVRLGFRGGTDLNAPLRAAVEQLEQPGWARADLLLITDGLVRVPRALVTQMDAARVRHGARVWGLLMWEGGATALRPLCDTLLALDPRRPGEIRRLATALRGL